MADTPDAPAIIEAPTLDKHLCAGPCTKTLRDTGKGVVRYGDPLLSQRCTSMLRNELDRLDVIASEMLRNEDGARSSTGADAAIRAHRNAGTKASPAPSYDLVNELIGDLRKWVIVKRQRAWRLGFVTSDIQELTSWLMEHLNLYVYDPETAGRLSEDMHRWHARLEKRAKAGTALIHKPVPCPSCRKMDLVQEPGSQVVKCQGCGLIQPAAVYEGDAADAAEAASGATEENPQGRKRPKVA